MSPPQAAGLQAPPPPPSPAIGLKAVERPPAPPAPVPAAPPVVVLLVGVVVGIFQAATSINEMTLSFLPKLIAVTLVFLVLGSWQLQILVDFARRIFERIPDVAG